MAESVVSAAATQLTNLIVQEAKYLGGVDDQLKQLQTDLQMMQSFLRDADTRRAESDAVRQCVVQIKNIAYDIEDLIETFELKIASKRKGGCAKAIKRYTCIFKEGRSLHEIRSQIDEIRGRIDQWTRWLQIYGMKRLMEGGSSSSSWFGPRPDRRSYPHTEETVFGLDHKIKELVSVLDNDRETSSRVVAICGMAGVGKTTLAKKVYKMLCDKGCFDKFAWVYVSQQFEKEAIWEKILSCFGIETDQSPSALGMLLRQKDPEALARKLDKLLRENKCLVVLDDIWSTQAWNVLKPGIPIEGTNSKILLTSRNQAVAFHVDAGTHLHQLECLGDDASWDLFKKTAFPRGQHSPFPAATQLTNLIVQEAKYLGGVDDQLKQLKTDLQMMQSFLTDADARREESNAVRQCVVQIKSIAYDIEDLIETFELKIASKRKGGCAKAIKRYTCIFREATRLHEIRSQLDKIRGRIDQWTRWLQRYGMKSMMEGGSSSSACSRPKPDRCSYPHIEETVFGLDHGIEELVSVLGNHQETSKRVVAICGMAGVGKTTLAKKVYRELRDKTCFDKFAWVYVSQQFEKETVWEKILSCFGLVIDQTGLGKLDQTGLGKLLKQRDSDELARKLYNFLRDNRCLVVLDDIWSSQAWDILKPGFPEEETNSKILLTSRNQAVAFHVDARAHLLQLECLDPDASWDLFKKTAFPRGQYSPSPDHPRLEELGREMVKHCACLPLAIVVLGGVLAPKYGSYHEWQQVHDNVKSYIRRGMDCKVKDILSLSYDDLPSYLKPCFLYLAHFPEDYEMDVDVLVQMWIAEGFVSEVREEDNILLTMEDEAYHYLIELLERNMIRVGRQDSRTKKIRTCLMHDVMREFCLDKAREEISLHILDRSHEDVSVDGNNNIYRLAMHELAWSLSVPRVTHLRSFIYFGGNMNIPDSFRKEWYWFNKATYHIGNIGGVRTFKDATLAIFYTWIVIHVIKQTITHLFNNAFKRLRVLCVDKLPLLGCGALDNIGNLIHLRYLCLARCLLVKLPTSLGKLRRLKTLDLRVNSGDFSIRIPDDIWSLRQLQHLYLPESCHYKAKLKLGNLQNLQTLVNLPVKNSHSIASLVDLKNLRELRICGAIEIIDEAVRLRNYCCFSTCCCTGIGSDGQFQYVGVEEDPMPMLEKLPNLRILALEKRAFIGKKMEVSTNGFQSLEVLEIHLLPDLEEFSTAEGAMPRLCIFDVQDCSKLKLLSSQLPPIQA